jgi:hypothetical protein
MTDLPDIEDRVPYQILPEHVPVVVRWPCGICGDLTEKDEVVYRYLDADGDWNFVCDDCVEAGPDAIPNRLRVHAARLRAWADDLDREAERPWR